jgi:hypothetical protein
MVSKMAMDAFRRISQEDRQASVPAKEIDREGLRRMIEIIKNNKEMKKAAEEEIARGAHITKHRISL